MPNEKETTEYLKRGEVKTMAKDLSRLREEEARGEREKIAELKITQEQEREKARLEQAQIEAEERKKAEEPRPKPAGIEAGPLAIPYTPPKPSIIEKLWVRIALGIFILMNLAMLATFWYWYFAVRGKPGPAVPTVPALPTAPKPEIVIPPLVINERILDWGYVVPDAPRTINAIVVHSIYNALGGDPHDIEAIIQEYKLYGVAAHYLIDRDGIIFQTVPDGAIAFHAGVSRMPDGRTTVNDFSIGIELIYTKDETPTDKQYQALAGLIKYIQKRNDVSIAAENILGHKDIAPDRKTDPWNFNWEYFGSFIK